MEEGGWKSKMDAWGAGFWKFLYELIHAFWTNMYIEKYNTFIFEFTVFTDVIHILKNNCKICSENSGGGKSIKTQGCCFFKKNAD